MLKPDADDAVVVERPRQALTEGARPIERSMAALYDHYFSVKDYARRYPEPNASTLRFLLDHGAGQAQQVLDFGCGNGRYALALLQQGAAHVTGCDISSAALREFRERLERAGLQHRAHLLHGNEHALHGAARFDAVLLLFGVLSHVGDRAARQQVLRTLRSVTLPGGCLALTVPCKWRRRPLEAVHGFLQRLRGRAEGAQAEPGNIMFSRRLGGVPHAFFYHLYSVAQLKEELREAGWEPVAVQAESLLPEWLITQRPWLGRLDAAISAWLPAWLGYGIRVAARPA